MIEGSRLEAGAAWVFEAVLLGAIVAAPWPYGSALDVARYALVAVLLGGMAVWMAGRAIAGAGLPRMLVPALALPALALVQLVSGQTVAPVETLEAVLVSTALLGALVFWSERGGERGAAVRLVVAVLAVCAAEAVFGAVQWSRAPDRIYGRASPIVTTPFGSFVDHNHFAGLMGMGVMLALGTAIGHARRAGGATPASAALGGLSLGLVAAQMASRSRGGLVALSGGLVALALFATWRSVGRTASDRPASAAWHVSSGRRLALMAGLAAVALAFGLAAVPSGTRDHLATLVQGSPDSSGSYRLDIAAATLRLARSRPLLGSGLGAYADALPPFKPRHGDVRTTHAESDVLEFLAEAGLAGVVLFAWLGSRLWARFADRLRHGHGGLRKGIAMGAMAAVAALSLHSLFDFNLRLPSNALVFVCLLGLAAASRSQGSGIGGRVATGLAALALAVLALAAVWRAEGARALGRALAAAPGELRLVALDQALSRHPYLAEAYRERGLIWRDRGWASPSFGTSRLGRSEADLDRAVQLRPQWGEAWADLAWVLWRTGRTEQARAASERAAGLDPTHLAIRLSRAELLARVDGADAGIAELARLRAERPAFGLPDALAVALSWTREASRLRPLTDGSAGEQALLLKRLATP